MKLAVVVVLALAAAAAAEQVALSRPVIDEELIAHINSHPSALWTAGRNEVFEGKTYADIMHLFGDEPVDTLELPVVAYPNFRAPEEFDGREAWGACFHAIRDQGQCGSCWAHSASEALSERVCLQTDGQQNVVLSPQDLVSCDNADAGCNGGSGPSSWSHMVNNGVATDACWPYTSGKTGSSGTCYTTCPSDGSDIVRYKATNVRRCSDETCIQAELVGGPGYIRFDVYSDFMQYKSGVYHHVSGGRLGGHAVKPVGWGVDNGTKYWLIANSWGTGWGDSGFFKMLRGNNECGIEGGFVVGDYAHNV